ncbi:NTE family protein [Granulicella rosea]|uniref:NTE family protein n=1 Tax=Granulicella rosea TaxID=474952 RepID=A0A239E8G2_9BACT|nr:patatin-like phospholipase family protein [Granulicella rosea]SNS41040.1 NTE family protein [Granulicella rosea]
MSDYCEPVLDPAGDAPAAGIGLCLSGGGYRAMVFHLGCLWRLNEIGLLGGLKRISSVSGGSIAAAVLGMNWSKLGLSPATPTTSAALFRQYLVDPVRTMASTTVDAGAILGGIFLPGTIADHVAGKYDSLLFHGKTLQDLPSDAEGPRFVINATNVQSGKLMRFSRPYMRDFRVGQILNPSLPLAIAVGASSAFPPILSPAEIDLDKYGLAFAPADGTEDLAFAPYTTKLVLSDGGVYDNLGLETVWKRYDTVLVSDGGARFSADAEPHTDWARHAYRVLDIIDSQVRSLRVRQLVDSYSRKVRQGAYWGMWQDASVYKLDLPFACPIARTAELASTPTRLQEMDPTLQERIVNWGYMIADTSLRKNFAGTTIAAPTALPYPASAI